MINIKKIGDNINKSVRNLSTLQKEINDITIKDIRNLFRLKNKMKHSKTE